MPPYVRHRTRSIPLNAARNGRELSLQCSIFALAKSEHCQLTARPIGLMGLIATSLFGTRGFPCSHLGSPPTTRISFVYYVYLILLAGSKSVVINICEIKYLKNMVLCKTRNGVDSAKRGLEQTRIKPTVLDFRSDEKRALPAHRASDRIDGIDRGFPFRNARLPSWAGVGRQGSHHSSRPYILFILL